MEVYRESVSVTVPVMRRSGTAVPGGSGMNGTDVKSMPVDEDEWGFRTRYT